LESTLNEVADVLATSARPSFGTVPSSQLLTAVVTSIETKESPAVTGTALATVTPKLGVLILVRVSSSHGAFTI